MDKLQSILDIENVETIKGIENQKNLKFIVDSFFDEYVTLLEFDTDANCKLQLLNSYIERYLSIISDYTNKLERNLIIIEKAQEYIHKNHLV